jgi:hypothetical protein
MNFITQMITQRVAGVAARALAPRLGVSEATAERAVLVAVPLILAALARNAARPEGAKQLHQAVNEDHDGSIFDNLGGYLGDPQAAANGAGILGHVFGEQQGAVQSSVAQATGLDPNAAGDLLATVAPLVLGAVGQTQRQNDLDPGGLSELLDTERQQTEAAAPGLTGALNSMLDANRDGSVTDDVGRLLGSLFK